MDRSQISVAADLQWQIVENVGFDCPFQEQVIGKSFAHAEMIGFQSFPREDDLNSLVQSAISPPVNDGACSMTVILCQGTFFFISAH